MERKIGQSCDIVDECFQGGGGEDVREATVPGDSCPPTPPCGDGLIDTRLGEVCDPGNGATGAAMNLGNESCTSLGLAGDGLRCNCGCQFDLDGCSKLARGVPDIDNPRLSAFQSASLISSTGFASTDSDRWPDRARGMLILLMAVGGCAGSAAGCPKVIRPILVFRRVHCDGANFVSRIDVAATLRLVRTTSRPMTPSMMRYQ